MLFAQFHAHTVARYYAFVYHSAQYGCNLLFGVMNEVGYLRNGNGVVCGEESFYGLLYGFISVARMGGLLRSAVVASVAVGLGLLAEVSQQH